MMALGLMTAGFFVSALAYGSAPASAQPRTIVGDWAETRAGCASPMAGLISIAPMAISTDEYVCRFDGVSRAGSTVNWTGVCEEPSGRKTRERVSATEAGGRLTIRFGNGHAWQPLMRCPR
jgi:hypothetical protein